MIGLNKKQNQQKKKKTGKKSDVSVCLSSSVQFSSLIICELILFHELKHK